MEESNSNNKGLNIRSEDKCRENFMNINLLKENKNRSKNKKNKIHSDDEKNNSNDKKNENKEKKEIIICPNCNSSLKKKKRKNDQQTVEENIFCEKCRSIFSFIDCLHCKRYIYLPENMNYHINTNIKCPYIDCNKDFCYTSCGSCNKFFGIKNKLIEGTNFICPYEDCGIKFISVNCVNEECRETCVFAENKYYQGVPTQCLNCKIVFAKFTCYFCCRKFYLNDTEGLNSIYEGKSIQCPYNDCKKGFNIFFCLECERPSYFAQDKLECEKAKNFNLIKCYYQDCQQYFIKVTCPKCLGIIQYRGKNNLEGKMITCSNNKCSLKFQFYYCLNCKEINYWEGKKYHILFYK